MTPAATCTSTSAAPAAPATGIDIVRIKLTDPIDAKYLSRVTHGRAGVSCHDNNI